MNKEKLRAKLWHLKNEGPPPRTEPTGKGKDLMLCIFKETGSYKEAGGFRLERARLKGVLLYYSPFRFKFHPISKAQGGLHQFLMSVICSHCDRGSKRTSCHLVFLFSSQVRGLRGSSCPQSHSRQEWLCSQDPAQAGGRCPPKDDPHAQPSHSCQCSPPHQASQRSPMGKCRRRLWDQRQQSWGDTNTSCTCVESGCMQEGPGFECWCGTWRARSFQPEEVAP